MPTETTPRSDRIEIIKEVLVLPTGMTATDDETHLWALRVTWRGPFDGRSGGGYSVSQHGRELSRAGRWGYPERFQRWQYRFETLDEALAKARAEVDQVTVMGRTFAEFQKLREGS